MTAPAAHNLAAATDGRRRRAHRAGRRGGFSLLELVLVMVVMCAIAAAAVPQLKGFLTASGSRDTATQVVALAQYARAKAAGDALIYRLTFDEAAGEYWLSAEDAAGSGEFVPLGNDFGRVFPLPYGMRVELVRTNSSSASPTAGPGDVDFRPDGTCDPAIVRLTDADGIITLIGSPSPAEPFRVMTAEEVQDL